MEVGHIHPFGGSGLPQKLSVGIVPHRAGIGGGAPQAQGVDGHVHRPAPRAGKAVFDIPVIIDAVAAHRGQLHRLLLKKYILTRGLFENRRNVGFLSQNEGFQGKNRKKGLPPFKDF